jgi:hypothetical protein
MTSANPMDDHFVGQERTDQNAGIQSEQGAGEQRRG